MERRPLPTPGTHAAASRSPTTTARCRVASRDADLHDGWRRRRRSRSETWTTRPTGPCANALPRPGSPFLSSSDATPSASRRVRPCSSGCAAPGRAPARSRPRRSSTSSTSCGDPGRMLVVDAGALFEVLAATPAAPRLARVLAEHDDLAAPHVVDVEVLGVIAVSVCAGRSTRRPPRRRSRSSATGRRSGSATGCSWTEHGSCVRRFENGTPCTWRSPRHSTRRC